MLGLSARKYSQAVRQFTEAYGLEKSAVSEHFIEASRAKLKDMMESRLDKLRLCALDPGRRVNLLEINVQIPGAKAGKVRAANVVLIKK